MNYVYQFLNDKVFVQPERGSISSQEVHDKKIKFKQSDDEYVIGQNVFQYAEIEECDFSNIAIVGEQAFAFSDIKQVSLPQTTMCGSGAFAWCKNLKQADVAIWKVPEFLFSQCSNLEQVQLQEGVMVVEKCAFAGTNITKLSLPQTIQHFDLSSIISSPLEELELPDKDFEVVFSGNFDKSHFPKLTKESFLKLLRNYPQAYYELMPSEHFGGRTTIDKKFADECKNTICEGMKNRGDKKLTDPQNLQILALCSERLSNESKLRGKERYSARVGQTKSL